MTSFLQRNILVYVRDKTSVFFSLLSVIILIALYVLFLGDMTANNLPEFPSKKPLLLMWFIAGVLAVASMTTTLGALGIYVEDQANNAQLDFRSSPITRSQLMCGYIGSAFLIGISICIFTLCISLLYVYFAEQATISFTTILQLLGVIVLAVLASGSIALCIVSFFQTMNAFVAISTIVGTLLGFVAGIYIPLGSLPNYLQIIVKIFPVSHAASLFRQLLMEPFLQDAFSGTPLSIKQDFEFNMGVLFSVKGTTISKLQSIVYLLVTSLIFLTIAFLQIRKKVVK